MSREVSKEKFPEPVAYRMNSSSCAKPISSGYCSGSGVIKTSRHTGIKRQHDTSTA